MTLATTDRINLLRAVVTWGIRGAGVLFVVHGSYLVLKKVLFGVGAGIPVHQVYTGVGEEHSLYRGLAMVVVAGVVLLLSGRLARWIVRVPADGCPRCGYGREGAARERCPECGWEHG